VIAQVVDVRALGRLDRIRRLREARRAFTGALILLSTGLAVAALVIYPADARTHALAVELAGEGRAAAAITAETRHEGRAGIPIRVTFTVGGTTVHATLADARSEAESTEWRPLREGDGYALPLQLRYLPRDPRVVMAEQDVAADADPASATTLLVLAGLAALPALVVLVRWRLTGRRPGFLDHAREGSACGWCGHRAEPHVDDSRCTARTRRGLCACPGWATVRPELVFSGSSLHIRLPLLRQVVARSEVLAVHGTVPGRPAWSDRTIIETLSGQLILPRRAGPPAELIPELQQWADVDDVATRSPGA
jgi:hypothetical protein